MSVLEIAQIIFGIYIIIFCTLLVIFATRRDKYSFSEGDISDLGHRLPGLNDEIFSLSLILFSVLNFAFWGGMDAILVENLVCYLAKYSYLVANIFLCLVAFVPENKMGSIHFGVGVVLFLSTCISCFSFVVLFMSRSDAFRYLGMINIVIIIMGVLFGIAELIKPGESTTKLLHEVKKRRGWWEWSIFALCMLWIFGTNLLLIVQ